MAAGNIPPCPPTPSTAHLTPHPTSPTILIPRQETIVTSYQSRRWGDCKRQTTVGKLPPVEAEADCMGKNGGGVEHPTAISLGAMGRGELRFDLRFILLLFPLGFWTRLVLGLLFFFFFSFSPPSTSHHGPRREGFLLDQHRRWRDHEHGTGRPVPADPSSRSPPSASLSRLLKPRWPRTAPRAWAPRSGPSGRAAASSASTRGLFHGWVGTVFR